MGIHLTEHSIKGVKHRPRSTARDKGEEPRGRSRLGAFTGCNHLLTASANLEKFSMNRSTSSWVCWTDMSHCSVFPQGGRNTPPLCCINQWAWL